MAQAFAVSETIEAPPEQVWETLTDWERAPEWMKGVQRYSASGPTEVGTQLTFTARGKERPSEIVALDPGRSVTLRSVQGKVSADYTYSCEPAGDATRVSLDATCTTEGPVLGAVSPLLRFLMKRTDSGQLAALKTVVESGSSG